MRQHLSKDLHERCVQWGHPSLGAGAIHQAGTEAHLGDGRMGGVGSGHWSGSILVLRAKQMEFFA